MGMNMESLIPERNDELDDIARRIIVIKLEYPETDINGMLSAIRSKINRQILELSVWAGEDGLLWHPSGKR